MVVGFENVGKTSLLDCLFPLTDLIEVPYMLGLSSYLYSFTLEGKYLRQSKINTPDVIFKQYILESKKWIIEKTISSNQNVILELKSQSKEELKLIFQNQKTSEIWYERLSRLISNSATHGIEVNKHIWKSSLFDSKRISNQRQNRRDQIELSAWDFAGQSDYYNTHHYFLSNRSTFLILYRMDKGDKGLQSLDFWFKSLSSHLDQNHCDSNNKPYYSIIIVGTFLDSEFVSQEGDSKNERRAKVMEMYTNNGLKSPPFYIEVSCSTLENIDILREIIFNVTLGHSYMGENVPVGYLAIEKSINFLRKQYQQHPIIGIKELIKDVQSRSSFLFDSDFTKRALTLLHEWGTCIYFNNSTELSKLVVLDPQYLTSKILGDLFRADEVSRKTRANGIIEYSQLKNIWMGSATSIDIYLSLLEKFEVCFVLKVQQDNNSKEMQNQNQNLKKKGSTNSIVKNEKEQEEMKDKKIIIPNLLPDSQSIEEIKEKNRLRLNELSELQKTKSNRIEVEEIQNERKRIEQDALRINQTEIAMQIIKGKLELKWPTIIPRGKIEIERIFSFNQVPSEMVSRLLVRFHEKIVDDIIWRRGVLLNYSNDSNVLCLLEVNMLENLFEIKIRGNKRNEENERDERDKCLEMMSYIYEEVKIVSSNYGGVKWRECVRSPHFSKALVELSHIIEDCKLELKDRKLKCPMTHFPIYGEHLLIKAGLIASDLHQNNIGIFFPSFIKRNKTKIMDQYIRK